MTDKEREKIKELKTQLSTIRSEKNKKIQSLGGQLICYRNYNSEKSHIIRSLKYKVVGLKKELEIAIKKQGREE